MQEATEIYQRRAGGLGWSRALRRRLQKEFDPQQRGEKIWSFEVEEAIREHSATLECASYGFRSNLIEGEVKVSVVAKDGSELSEREPRKFCYTTMAHFQVPPRCRARP